ncbi:hypothetical protein [Sulfitobacter aestuariivivens]|uniref:Excinuclease ABC subunit A n=1 Tax=Sulfitobacter aestuariivivens TaxID=2766981 RepID=A0A927D0C7_9RHOB|nr:hypothetical protein [Sulfitobacter aestuariivivens]MBD3662689.1 hypothetical protein [Sulfitobacter aestuariivivens]
MKSICFYLAALIFMGLASSADAANPCRGKDTFKLSDGTVMCFEKFGVLAFTSGDRAVSARFLIQKAADLSESAFRQRGIGLCRAFQEQMQGVAQQSGQKVSTFVIIQSAPSSGTVVNGLKITGQSYNVVTDSRCREQR